MLYISLEQSRHETKTRQILPSIIWLLFGVESLVLWNWLRDYTQMVTKQKTTTQTLYDLTKRTYLSEVKEWSEGWSCCSWWWVSLPLNAYYEVCLEVESTKSGSERRVEGRDTRIEEGEGRDRRGTRLTKVQTSRGGVKVSRQSKEEEIHLC